MLTVSPDAGVQSDASRCAVVSEGFPTSRPPLQDAAGLNRNNVFHQMTFASADVQRPTVIL